MIDVGAPIPVETLSPGELKFERYRRRVGLVLAPTVFVTLLLVPTPTLSGPAHRLAAIIAAVVVLWITEALPMPVTALLGAVAAVVLRVAPAKEVFAPFADPLIFLFIGSFILARAMFLHGLDRRLAFAVLSLRWVGARPARILVAFGAVTAVHLGLDHQHRHDGDDVRASACRSSRSSSSRRRRAAPRSSRRYATGLMLMTSFAASIGGLATPVGTPPNVIGLGFIRQLARRRDLVLPVVMIGVPGRRRAASSWLSATSTACVPPACGRSRGQRGDARARARAARAVDARPALDARRVRLTVACWVIPGVVALVAGERSDALPGRNARCPEAVAALVGAVLLFLLPGRRAASARSTGRRRRRSTGAWCSCTAAAWRWGCSSFQTGLAEAVGRGLTGMLPVSGELGLLVASVVIAVLVSEDDEQHRVGEHGRPGGDRDRRRRRRSAGARARRDDGREPRLHAAGLDPLQRDRVRLGLHADRADDPVRRPARRGGRSSW